TTLYLTRHATTSPFTVLSLHDALPILEHLVYTQGVGGSSPSGPTILDVVEPLTWVFSPLVERAQQVEAMANGSTMRRVASSSSRSEEHTSELQSRFDLVCRLLLEKKK